MPQPRPRAAALTLASVLASAALVAQERTPRVVSPGTGAIRGQVTNLRTGVPVEGATVRIVEIDRREAATVTSGPDGAYAFEAIAFGRYRLFAENLRDVHIVVGR